MARPIHPFPSPQYERSSKLVQSALATTAHPGVSDNEEADRLAKGPIISQVSEIEVVVMQDSTTSKVTVAASEQRICQKLNKEWRGAWDKHKHGRDLYKLEVFQHCLRTFSWSRLRFSNLLCRNAAGCVISSTAIGST